jgi:uncharacterized protein YdhG (YjbR/CyaY superfamily)
MAEKPKTVDEYFSSLAPEAAVALQAVREAIHRGIPGAQEKISYAIPAVVLEGQPNLHFAAWADHVGVYPALNLPEDLIAATEPFRKSKGTLEFKYADGMPVELIERVARALAAPAP